MTFAGTHRVRTAQETLRWIAPLFERVGITRLADVTWLDDLGLPVYQAVRPGAYLLSVSQGKGLTPELAKVSAAMEAVEMWHAERVEPGELTATVGEVEPTLPYGLEELSVPRRHHLNPGLRLCWSRARALGGGPDIHVPSDFLCLDGRVGQQWRPLLFETSSNGLASGNTYDEAVLHGLYEVIERDAATRPGARALDLRTVSGPVGDVVETLWSADATVWADVLDSPLGLPCFRAWIVSDVFPVPVSGAGCHLDKEVALCRALTEAAQVRVTAINGVRDDVPEHLYTRAGRRRSPPSPHRPPGAAVSFADLASVRHRGLGEDLDLVTSRVQAFTGRSPLVVDHTRPDLSVPVVHVVCPGLAYDPESA